MIASLTPGTALLGTAAFSSILATILLFYEYVVDERLFSRLTRAVAGITTLSLAVSLGYLTVQFVTEDYSNAYVWENTANYLSLLYKVTGVYAANEGSILLWALLASVVATATVFMRRFDARGARLVQSLTMGIVSVFSVMLVTASPFTPLSEAFPGLAANGTPLDGSGLNPLLVDPFMAIHPPITFSSYALLVVPFALGVSHFVAKLRGHESPFVEWIDSTTRWLRLSWVLLTAAITLGGIWAYRVLGWGGFWSWDPVETAVLIPWLGLTAVVHTLNRYRRTGSYRILAPVATAMLFPLVIYATTVVRSGVFRSVHSFASGGIGAGVLFLLGSTTLLAVGPAVVYWFIETTGTDETDGSTGSLLEQATIFHAAVLAFITLAFVSMWGLSFPVLRNAASGIEVSVNARYYNLWSFPVVVFMLFAGGAYAQSELTSKRITLATIGVVLALTAIVGVTIAPTQWQLATPEAYSPLYYRLLGGLSALTIVPPAAYFASSWTARYVTRFRKIRSRQVRLKETGVVLIHVGAAVLIVAVTLVYVFSTTASVGIVGATALADGNDTVVRDVGNSSYSVEVTNYRTENDPSATNAALTPAEVLTVNESAAGVLVRGEITAVEQYENVTIAQVDGSSVWLAGDEDESLFRTGEAVVARGSLSTPRSPNIDRLVYTDDQNMGPVSNPPTNIYEPRVVDHIFDVTVYKSGSLVAQGSVAEQSYRDSEMRTNDALIQRGAGGDTYVVGTMTNDGMSVRVSRFPLANQIWIGVLLMIVGMSLVFVFDPVAGARSKD